MRVLICGDRDWDDSEAIYAAVAKLSQDDVVISGGARGADTLAEQAALAQGLHCTVYRAQWKRYGRAAGPIRNQRMLDDGKPDLVLYFHSDLRLSKGTADMVRRARKAGVSVKDGTRA